MNVLLAEILEDLLVISNQSRVGLQNVQLNSGKGSGCESVMSVVDLKFEQGHTTGRCRIVAKEPRDPSPIAILRKLTGGFSWANKVLTM